MANLNIIKRYNLNLQERLNLAFIVTALICGIVGFIGWGGATMLGSNINTIGHQSVPSLQAILKIKKALSDIGAAENTLLNPLIRLDDRQQLYNAIEKAFDSSEEAIKNFESLELSDELVKSMQGFKLKWNQLKSHNKNYINISGKIDDLRIENPQKLALELEHQFGLYKSSGPFHLIS